MELAIFKVIPFILGYSHSPYIRAYGGYHARVILLEKKVHISVLWKDFIYIKKPHFTSN
jgi:hypothetical protein